MYGERKGSRAEVRGYALVSPMDAHLRDYKYRMTDSGYAYYQTWRRVFGIRKRVNVYLHREILGLEHGNKLEGHHIDDDPLNCQRWNLEVVTRSENERYKNNRNIRTRVFRST